jgi:hypothetical protein
MAHQLTRPRASRPPVPPTMRFKLPADDCAARELEERWPPALCVLFIAGSAATLWALIIAGLLWLLG